MNKLQRIYIDKGVLGTLIFLLRKFFLKFQNRFLAKRYGWCQVSFGEGLKLLGARHITIGKTLSTGRYLWLEAVHSFNQQTFSPQIKLGNCVNISDFTHIAAINLVHIGNGCLIGSKVLITDHNHGGYGSDIHSSPDEQPNLRLLVSSAAVIIEDNVFIGDNVVVLPGAHIEKGCVVAANSIVVGHIPAYSMVVGQPARVIKSYNSLTKRWEACSQNR